MEAERRAVETELRLTGGESPGVRMLSGYAALYGSLSVELGSGSRRFREEIAPGAFRAALAAGANTFAYFNHGVTAGGMGTALPLGSTRDGSLRLSEDARGLAFELDLPDTSDGRDLAVMVERGTVRGVSFAFPTKGTRDTWRQGEAGLLRTIHEIPQVLDVSPTHQPAYPDTALALRSLSAWETDQAGTERRARKLRLLELEP